MVCDQENIVFGQQHVYHSWNFAVALLEVSNPEDWSWEHHVEQMVKALHLRDGQLMVCIEDIQVPLDPDGSFLPESAWGQAEFLGGENVMDLVSG